jgi:hypothetical protein
MVETFLPNSEAVILLDFSDRYSFVCHHVVHRFHGETEQATFHPSCSLKNAVFWNMMPCGSCKMQHFRGAFHLHHQGRKIQQARNISSNEQLKHTAKKVWFFLTRATQRHIPEESILHSYHCENLKSSIPSLLLHVGTRK